MSDSLQPHESQHTRPPCPSPTLRVHSDSRPVSQWCHPAFSSSVIPFSCPQSLPASESFPLSNNYFLLVVDSHPSTLLFICPIVSDSLQPTSINSTVMNSLFLYSKIQTPAIVKKKSLSQCEYSPFFNNPTTLSFSAWFSFSVFDGPELPVSSFPP